MKMKMRLITLAIISLIAISTMRISASADEIPLPQDIQDYCADVGEEFDICPCLLMSLVYTESRGTAENVTQITSRKWFKEGIEYCDADDYKTNPYSAIRVCGYYLRKWYEQLGDADIYLILDCWHEGYENAINTYNERRPSYYARTIADRSAEWEEIFYEGSNG